MTNILKLNVLNPKFAAYVYLLNTILRFLSHFPKFHTSLIPLLIQQVFQKGVLRFNFKKKVLPLH